MKIKTKILIILIGIFITIIMLNTYVYGFNVSELTGTATDLPEVKNFGNEIITIISVIGSVVSVIVLIVLGIKYMIGSIEEKAQYKKSLMPYFIGAVFVFAASTIASIIYNIGINIG